MISGLIDALAVVPARLGDITILAAPLAAGLVVLTSHARLGEAVLGRGIVFIDLAIAQLAALGAMLATQQAAASGVHDHGSLQPMAIAAGAASALLGALVIAWLGRRFAVWREAVIGLIYVGAAVAAILVASAAPEGHHAMSRMLSGDVLWTDWPDLLPISIATAIYLLVRRLAGRHADRDVLFYPAFAILVSLSVPMLGVYLVFASLIVPALLRAACPRIGPIAGVTLASAAWAVGLLASLLADAPSGPCVVVALLLLVTGALLRTTGGRRSGRRRRIEPAVGSP